ncbi:MAG: DUF4136 domain-containing protein [Ginsengibacter sp.]
MKKTFLFLACCMLYVASEAQVKVGADKNFTKSLNDYTTYAWSTSIDQIPSDQIFIAPNGVYVFNNESVRSKIKDAIEFELSAKGYQKVQNNPDILVIFSVTERPGKLRTYNGYEMIDNGLDSVRTPNDVEVTDIDAGTLIINLIDAKTGVVAWQGYASGILKPDMINDNMKVREAVASIFSKFDFKAKK